MIKVSFFEKKDILVGFEASGHAGYGAYGSDIVCAAVSGILLTALDGIEKIVGVRPKVRRCDEKGYLRIQLPLELSESARRDASLLMRAAENGLRSISEQYPGFVRVINRNRQNPEFIRVINRKRRKSE